MDPARWQAIERLFHEAAAVAPEGRRAFVVERAGDDARLAAEVLAMLDADAHGGSLLEIDVAGVAAGVLAAEPAAARLGQVLGPYRLQRVLGEGGMGVVYLAAREDLGSVAAIKILRDASLSPSRLERFAAEQRTLAGLRHPAIAQIYDAATLPDGTPWFAMEYVDGLTLIEYVHARATSLAGRLHLFRAVAEAVDYAHRHAVVHRDLKPANVLVTTDGTVKLLDFGLARHLDEPGHDALRTRTGLRLFTPAYAAPELFRDGAAGTPADVYALGVILYELLTNRLPFDPGTRSPVELMAAITAGGPLRPSSLARARAQRLGGAARLPEASRAQWADLDVLCLTAMHHDPERRYRTVDALLRDVGHFLAGEPLDARPDSLRYRAATFARRHRQAVAAGAVALAAVLGLAAWYAVSLRSARDAALAESARAQRIQAFTMGLFRAEEEAGGPPEDLRVLTLVDRGLQEARALDREPRAQLELFETLGAIYQRLGRIDVAEDLLGTALARRRTLDGATSAAAAQSQVAVALLRSEQARYDEAERLAREALEILRQRRPAAHPDVLRAGLALAHVLEERGRYDEAIPLLEQADATSRAVAEVSAERLEILNGLANNHFYAGRYERAEALSRAGGAVARQLYGARHPAVAESLVNLGAIRHQQGRYADAEGFYREALAITEGWFGPDHPHVAADLTMLGRTLVFEERFDEALALLRRALVIREHAYGPAHPRVASTLNELGTIALRRDRLDEAEAAFRRMLAIYRAAYGGEHDLVGTALSNVASVLSARKAYAAAEPLYRQALAIFVARVGPDHASTAIAHIKLGRALLRQGRYRETLHETLQGYDVLARQADPSISYLRAARSDLAEAYAAMGDAANAARYRLPSTP